MKQFKTLLIAVALTLGATSFANAQSKVAHIATQELIEQLPSFKSAMTQLEKLEKTYDTQIKDMVTEAQNTMKRYDAEAPTKTDEENAKRMTELQQTQQSIGAYRSNALQELEKKRVELIKPVMEKAHKAIQDVARAKKFDYVLDSSTGSGVLMADGYDLMPDVKKALGI